MGNEIEYEADDSATWEYGQIHDDGNIGKGDFELTYPDIEEIDFFKESDVDKNNFDRIYKYSEIDTDEGEEELADRVASEIYSLYKRNFIKKYEKMLKYF